MKGSSDSRSPVDITAPRIFSESYSEPQKYKSSSAQMSSKCFREGLGVEEDGKCNTLKDRLGRMGNLSLALHFSRDGVSYGRAENVICPSDQEKGLIVNLHPQCWF